MSNWKLIDKVYLYDGTLEGLFTIVFDTYVQHSIPNNIIAQATYSYNLLEETKQIQTDYEKSSRIFHGIMQNISQEALYWSYTAFQSSSSYKEMAILKYILRGFQVGPKINTMLSLDEVLQVYQLLRNVLREAHRLKGLVRLSEIDNNLFYSSIHPDNNVIENVGKHLIKRFPTQNLILHDKKREIAFLYNQYTSCVIHVPSHIHFDSFSDTEKKFQSLWKTFFQTIAIPERKNARLQMQYMPKKYWQDLPEMQ